MKPVLELKQLEFAWSASDAFLQIDSFQMEAGEKVFLHGPSGSGKSTLLNLIGGVLVPQKGEIICLDQNIVQMKLSKRDEFRGNHMGFIFQMFNLLPYLSAIENVTLPAEFSAVKKKKILKQANTLENEAMRLLNELKLDSSHFNQNVTHLSVGQQQRVALARALLGGPELLIADEPTSALDSAVRDRFIELLLKECVQTKSAVLFVSHDLSLASHFDRTVSLVDLNQIKKNKSPGEEF